MELKKAMNIARRGFNLSDKRLARNVGLALNFAPMDQAVMVGTVRDHMAIPQVLRMGNVAAEIVLAVEQKLGRRLSRERAQALRVAFESRTAAKTPTNVVPLWLKRAA